MTARIVTTNDFVASFFPQRTSWGQLPGGIALEQTVADLRTQAGSALWIDTGDFSQGSALGALSDGTWPFLAMRELSVDIAVAGNHELDWGLTHLQRWAPEVPFALLAGNADLGFGATEVHAVAEHAVGVIGLTLPAMDVLHPGIAATDPAALVPGLAADVRRRGAEHVVLALHDGVDPVASAPPSTSRIEELCAAVREHVDVALGGHTLACHAGSLGGLPFLQPWPFGSQIGVADLHGDGRVELRLIEVTRPRPWSGPGARVHAALEAEVVGHLGRPLTHAAGRDASLSQAVADQLLRIDDQIDATFVGGDFYNQAPRDGAHAHLPAGDITMAQVLRLTPLTGARSAWGGQLLGAELSHADTDRVLTALTSEPAFPGGPALPGAVARRTLRGPSATLVLAPYRAVTADRILARDLDWHPVTTTWRDALLATISR
jgi:2',3'-cyclic-nucleotide 2'-phosphodiesterase (5'-nucleotidase family)